MVDHPIMVGCRIHFFSLRSAGSSLVVRNGRFGSRCHLAQKANCVLRVSTRLHKARDGIALKFIQSAETALLCSALRSLLTEKHASIFTELRHPASSSPEQSGTSESYRAGSPQKTATPLWDNAKPLAPASSDASWTARTVRRV